MEKVLKAQWNPKKESEEKVFENVTFETAVRGLDVLYRSGGGAYELDVCVDGRTVAVAALTGTAGYRDLETVHAEIPPIEPGTYTVSFRTDGNPYVEEFIFTESSFMENAGAYEPAEPCFRETDNDLITATDSLGRTLPGAEECGEPKKRFVGLFYWTWRNQNVKIEPTNLSKVLREHPDAEYDESVLNQITEENIQEFYNTYHKNMKKMAEEYGKTAVQKKYLEKKYNEIKLPVEYESYSSWDTMIMYVETYSIILAIIVGFICAGIFADDFQTKADAVFFLYKEWTYKSC